MPKISIIVPVYKAEAYIRRCLNSILDQTFTDFECILIDDGSPDSSGLICDEYASKDSRVKVFHTINRGVAFARQLGLENAGGEYVIQVDPDDWIEPNMLVDMYEYIKRRNADLLICDFWVDKSQDDREYIIQRPSTMDHKTILQELYICLHGSCCNKLVRRSIISRYNISFNLSLSLCEDLLFNSMILKHKVAVVYLNKAFYHYDQYSNHQSIVRSYSRASFDNDKRMFEIFNQEFLDDNETRVIVNNNMGNLLVTRAYLSHTFSSLEFAKLCFPYRKYVLGYKQSKIDKIILYLSCIGLYTISEAIRDVLLKIRNIAYK